MTRETRIGLIVGLMFIVLFGVVLSELGTVGQEPLENTDNTGRGFYARAPVTRPPQIQPRQREEHALTARRRTEAQGPRANGGARRPAPGRQPESTGGTTQPPRRTIRRRTEPTGPVVRTDRREMTAEEFARSRGLVIPSGNVRTYTTRRGDNLTAIARKFYRTPSRKAVMKIFNANRNVLQTPDSIGVGVKIVIPN
ncbi:MAG: LysM peptidoglycan-binding domain-containing protein [Phycisphaerae bacterium]|jgi:nucleoid-associated protein YgaU|nr:LysM peptidoglycan-binding domain-containing protein [Phycisphaerae bacterium]